VQYHVLLYFPCTSYSHNGTSIDMWAIALYPIVLLQPGVRIMTLADLGHTVSSTRAPSHLGSVLVHGHVRAPPVGIDVHIIQSTANWRTIRALLPDADSTPPELDAKYSALPDTEDAYLRAGAGRAGGGGPPPPPGRRGASQASYARLLRVDLHRAVQHR